MHPKQATPVWLITAALACSLAACGSGSNSTGAGGTGSPTGGAGSTASAPARTCSTRGPCAPTRSTSRPTNGDAIQAEFNDLATLQADGNDFVAKHPVMFHMGSETVSDASFKLHGQSSWVQTVMLDGDRPKMQFDISFAERDESGSFTASASWCSTCRAATGLHA